MKNKYLLLTLFCLIIKYQINAQPNSNKQSDRTDYYIAENLIEDENFLNAIDLYNKMLETDPYNSDLNCKIGFCYLNTAQLKEKAIIHLENAIKYIVDEDDDKSEQNAPIEEAYFYLGKAYHVNNMFDKAMENLNKLKTDFKITDKEFLQIIDREIEMVNNIIELRKNPINMNIFNLGEVVNSSYSDHSPVINGDQSVLIFTSKREGSTGGEKTADGQYFEDIYISEFVDNKWNEPRSIGANINTDEHEASIGLAFDGQKLFIYKDDDNGSIYMSSLIGDVWSKPVKLGSSINTRFRETHASLSADGKQLYFTSDRRGGFGGLDIYFSELKADGTWGEAKNLGSTVNTIYDEEGPYIHPDGITLYFSSRGHKSMGGFDIFKTELNEFGTWRQPENIGYPINTTENDIFYIPTPDGKRSFYVSQRKGGLGAADIYLLDLPDAQETNIVIARGYFKKCKGKLPEIKITVTDVYQEKMLLFTPNASGKYIMNLSRGKKYSIVYEVDGEPFKTEEYQVPANAPFQIEKDTIELPSDEPCDEVVATKNKTDENLKQTDVTAELTSTKPKIKSDSSNVDESGVVYDEGVIIKNILFPFGKASGFKPDPNLDFLAKFLNENSACVIEIGAYADAKGSDDYNLKLTQKRAVAIKDYLVQRKVNAKQITTKGYGESNPIAINQNSDGTWNEEGQKFNRRIEFKVLKQAKKTILIKPISNIPENLKVKK